MKHNTNAKLITSAAAAVALAAAVSTTARADLILIGNPTSTQAYTFTPEAMNTLMVSSSGFGGTATFPSVSGPDSGKISFGTTTFTTESLVGNTLPIGPSPPGTAIQSLTYQATNDPDNPGPPVPFPDTLHLSIAWTELNNVMGGEPALVGTGTVLPGTVGDADFEMAFPVGGLVTVTGNFPTTCSLNNLGNCNILSGMEIDSTGFFEGGDATSTSMSGSMSSSMTMPMNTPEPMSSSMGLGLALFCLWGTYQLTRRARDGSVS